MITTPQGPKRVGDYIWVSHEVSGPMRGRIVAFKCGREGINRVRLQEIEPGAVTVDVNGFGCTGKAQYLRRFEGWASADTANQARARLHRKEKLESIQVLLQRASDNDLEKILTILRLA